NRRPPVLTDLSFLHLVCHTPDMYPNYYPRRREIVELSNYAIIHSEEFMVPIPDEDKNVDYEAFLGEIKRARVLKSWNEEVSEDEIIEKHSFQSGDLFRLISNADWLLYAFSELGRLLDHRDLLPRISNLRMRISKGVKKELLPIIRLDGIGRVRGRILFNAGFKTIKDLRLASISQLSNLPLIGLGVARKVKAQISDLKKGNNGRN
ncbi:MAG: hypothetical protein KAJ18_12380, partial [Candidatus Omnitrophica bacterium]|nr:hypothetical protein [Candidatus Omnitrophota bacterium]